MTHNCWQLYGLTVDPTMLNNMIVMSDRIKTRRGLIVIIVSSPIERRLNTKKACVVSKPL